MLTFFRRIRKSLLSGGKLTTYSVYAIGEVVLVVLGILIALQINNWNEDRIERRKEKLLLQEIHKEFVLNKQELESTVGNFERIYQTCLALESLFPLDPQTISRDTLSKYFECFSLGGSADLSMGTIASIVNTSSFEIITDEELRSLVVQWEFLWDDYLERQTNMRRLFWDYILG